MPLEKDPWGGRGVTSLPRMLNLVQGFIYMHVGPVHGDPAELMQKQLVAFRMSSHVIRAVHTTSPHQLQARMSCQAVNATTKHSVTPAAGAQVSCLIWPSIWEQMQTFHQGLLYLLQGGMSPV